MGGAMPARQRGSSIARLAMGTVFGNGTSSVIFFLRPTSSVIIEQSLLHLANNRVVFTWISFG